ncbi:LysR family transcriptional regulator [Ahniella affigens]|uniref:LysR family transcriptional regulator n=1 Tax=Ahniella affigens TaxID=2021234 RepID=A0A2P1PZB7_9GAMM|nr:LysR substrate-binding domain-containing protein [Ahniella affigens]AVQ00203.1 LysR family transcriptional regulator [Ahniella affigens]
MTERTEFLAALAAFESAARHQNFARAGDELHLTASAISHHVRKLEERLGVALFERHARGVRLTVEGRQLADSASSAMADLEGVAASLSAAQQSSARVRISTLHSLTYTWLIPMLADFRSRHPDIRLGFDTSASLTRFEEGGADLAIRHGPGHWPGLTAIHLMNDALFPVASPAFQKRHRIRSAEQLPNLPLIHDLARQGWLEWFRAASIVVTKIADPLVFSDSTDALQAAASGLGVALARQRIVTPWLARGELVQLPGPSVPTRWEYYLVYPAHRRLKPAAQAFVDWLLRNRSD